jgi:hypothetical protein
MRTAVEWLVDNILTKDEIYDDYGNLIGFKLLNTFTSSVDFTEYVEQAKQMEFEQRKKDFVNGYKSRAKESNLIFDETSEKYAIYLYAIYLFNETFKSE